MTWNILYCSDNNYAPYLGVSIRSLLENNKDAENITFYVVSDNISEDNTDRLKKQVAAYGEGRRLIIIDGRQWVERLVELKLLPYRGGLTTNLRLFFMEYIEEDVERLLYLDCDTIICGSLRELFNMPVEDAPAAVIIDSLSGNEYKKLIGFKSTDVYFNAGVILFDVENWKKYDCQNKLSQFMCDPKYKLPNNDQDFLNILLKDNKKIISPKYNFQTTHQIYCEDVYFSVYPDTAYYSNGEIDEARNAPVILHAYRFLGQFPWHKNAIHPWKELFWKNVEASEWSDLRPRENVGKLFAIERFGFKVLPKKLFLSIFKRYQTYSFSKRLKLMRKMNGGESKK